MTWSRFFIAVVLWAAGVSPRVLTFQFSPVFVRLIPVVHGSSECLFLKDGRNHSDRELDLVQADIVILTALPLECEAVLKYLKNLETVKVDSSYYHFGVYQGRTDWRVAVGCIGAGNAVATGETVRGFSYFKPQLGLFVGVAGGLKDVKVGDVVASTKIYCHESGKANEKFQPRPDGDRGAHRLQSAARHIITAGVWNHGLKDPKGEEFEAIGHVGPIAAGESVVASTGSTEYKRIKEYYGDALAIEMEGSGFLKGAWMQCEVEAIVVRGISDLVDDKSKSDEEGWQPVAAANAASFAFSLIDLQDKKKA